MSDVGESNESSVSPAELDALGAALCCGARVGAGRATAAGAG
jgi:hypothetical protein